MWELIVDSLFPLTLTSAVLWLLFFLSLVSVTVMIERALYFRANRCDAAALLEALRPRLKARDFPGARAAAEQAGGIQGRVAATALAEAGDGLGSFQEAHAAAQIRERSGMERLLAILGTLGSNAPFIGLFGTVLGIIRAFDDLSRNVEGGPATVMAGISEALVATAVGLFVAIPAVIAYNLFQRRIRRVTQQSEEIGRLIAGRLQARRSEDA